MNIKDFKWTEKRFGTRFANILKKLGGLSKDGTDGSIEYKDDQGNVTKLVTDSNFSSLLAKNGLIEVKWQELKDKRDNGKLIPGSLYRITDYQCTTSQENTQSAGHQFDIVLLALSENKLAEEGWAMEHPTDVYDVAFKGNYHNPITVRKCYIYCIDIENNRYNIVDCETLLGISGTNGDGEDFIIDEINKTCDATLYGVDDLNEENLTYNYFQNSNLSAWKVWYCLDNDKSRFAWADDSVNEGSPASIMVHSNKEGDTQFERDATQDIEGFYAWTNIYMITYFTNTETPSTNDVIYNEILDPIPTLSILSYTPAHEGTGLPNGRGVIYRLIDEWNNDVAYDFKNIQYVRKLTDGDYDVNGTDTWVYTFTIVDGDEIHDGSMGNAVTSFIGGYFALEQWQLTNNVIFLVSGFISNHIEDSHDCTIQGDKNKLKSCDQLVALDSYENIFISCDSTFAQPLDHENLPMIYIANQYCVTGR